MSNVQRVAGALFAKVRHVDDRLAAVDIGLQTVDFRLAAIDSGLVTVDFRLAALDGIVYSVLCLLDEQKKCIDEQKKRNDRWFAVVLGMNVCIFFCLMHLTTMYTKVYGLMSICVAHVHHEHVVPVEDRSTVSIMADELFAWLFLRPWYE